MIVIPACGSGSVFNPPITIDINVMRWLREHDSVLITIDVNEIGRLYERKFFSVNYNN